jgi:hypothetical protein
MKSTVERRLLIVNWCLVAVLALTLLIVLATTDFSIRLSSSFPASFPTIALVIAGVLGPSSFILIWGGKARWPNASHAAAALSQLIIATALIAPLVYIAASANYPLQDKAFHATDQFLGLDWRAYLGFVDRHQLGEISRFGYQMIFWPPFAIPIVLCLSGNAVRSYQFALAYVFALTITGFISMVYPAIGAYPFFALSPSDYPNLHLINAFVHMQDLSLLRAGKMHLVEIGKIKGIVTFPSFHAASAILFLWAFWPVRWMRPVAIVCNGLLLISTPIDGGHYFIDVIAGIAVAVLSIVAAIAPTRTIEHRLPFTGTQTLKQPRQVVPADEPAG